MKVFMLQKGYHGEHAYFISANSARGAAVKWNKAFPNDKQNGDSFKEVSDDINHIYKPINIHY